MSEGRRNFLVGGIAILMAGLLVFLILDFESDADRVESLGSQIKCPVCQGESIADSPAPMARDMMALVEERVDAGAGDDAIVDELLSSYTGAVLLDPPASGSTLLLWVAPFLAVLVGVATISWWQKHPKDDEVDAEGIEAPPRRLAPIMILAVAVGAIVLIVGFFVQDPSDTESGVAAIQPENLDEVSNETMEAVVAANLDHPEVDGMRLALAERYFQEGDYSSAFPHYLAVAGSENAADSQEVAALVRLGWMAWDGNGEAETAVGLFDQALEVQPASTSAMYLKGQVLWCAALDHEQAETLFEQVLESPTLEQTSRDTVQADLSALQAGQGCA